MHTIKTLFFGSAAGLAAVGAARAADLPVGKAAPVEYVRVCTTFGAGFFYIPGTDTCLRVGGRVRAEYGFIRVLNRNGASGDEGQYRTIGRFNIDARTQTAYGPLRAFVRFDISSRSGGFITSGSQQRFANAFPALGPDTFGRLQKFVDVDKAFVQFAGFTAGRTNSFFDFYAHDYELLGLSLNSDISATNALAYTATFGQGWSATISMEDPTFRRQPTFSNTGTTLGQTAFNVFTSSTSVSPVIIAADALGNPTAVAFNDVTQKNRLPDFVGVLRYDAPWGSAQLSAAVHEINAGLATFVQGDNGFPTPVGASAERVRNAYGWAIQGGVKINLPMIAQGDGLYLQGAYGEGAMAYTGAQSYTASEIVSGAAFSGASFPQFLSDAVVNPRTGRLDLSTSFTVVGSYLHYWAPTWRSAFFGSYAQIAFSKDARTGLGLVGFDLPALVASSPAAAAVAATRFAYSNILRDTNQIVVGANLVWSPVRELDIGVEGIYVRTALQRGQTNDLNKNPAGLTNAAGVPLRLSSANDTFQVRARVQRDF